MTMFVGSGGPLFRWKISRLICKSYKVRNIHQFIGAFMQINTSETASFKKAQDKELGAFSQVSMMLTTVHRLDSVHKYNKKEATLTS